jgi:glycine zipper 2TM protein
MLKMKSLKILVVAPVMFALVACQDLPGERNTQGAVIGGAAGAAAGAAIAKDNKLLGALIGGALGAGGGYVIAAKTDKISSNDKDSATRATRKSQENPATAEDARTAVSADLNLDGFVTLDEVVAMKEAGFSDEKMLDRLEGTDQVFELTQEQKDYLRERGVSRDVVDSMAQINQDERNELLKRTDVISQPSTP